MLASEQHRSHHHLWHFVRNGQAWDSLSSTDRAALTVAGWNTPRFEQESGSGIDFLGMHREMIVMVNIALQKASDKNWPIVTGWNSIPWVNDDKDWPVPAWQAKPPQWANETQWQEFTKFAVHARSTSRVSEMRQIATNFRTQKFLKTKSLDELGIEMEWSIHGWMHMRWSSAPPANNFTTDVDNDWLFVPWSSHVNKTFWKLHGWIDERINDWETATGMSADFSEAWVGPEVEPSSMKHMADIKLMSHLPKREEQPLPMKIHEHIVEGLLRLEPNHQRL